MSTLKNGVLLRNRKAESRPLMEVICSLLLFAPCLSALMISCCEYFLINVKLKVLELITAQTDISLRPSVIAVIVAVPLGLALRPAAAKFVLPCPDADRK